MRPALKGQAGFTLVEVIITLALGSMITAAMMSAFLVLARVQGGLEERVQVQQVTAIAEERLAADVASLHVVAARPGVLTLSAGYAGNIYQVDYSIRADGSGLVRTATGADGTVLDTQTVHGIASFTASCVGDPAVVTIQLAARGIAAPATDVKPPLVVTPRQPQKCPL